MKSPLRALAPLCIVFLSLAWTRSASANTIDVQQSGFGFVPQDITIQVGDAVTWHWTVFTHTVTEGTDGTIDGNEAWNSPLSQAVPTFSVTFDAAFVAAHPMPGGHYDYFCQPHYPVMIGSITVVSEPGASYCFGDHIDLYVTTDCPCMNFGAPGHGCANSVDANGALLAASGSTAVDPMSGTDTVVLHASSMPSIASIAAIFLQGSADAPAGIVFGDGVRCANGSLIRLGSKTTPGGVAQYPEAGNLSVSQRGMVTPGSGVTRYYQTYYRNSAASFCPPATFNVTNGYRIVW